MSFLLPFVYLANVTLSAQFTATLHRGEIVGGEGRGVAEGRLQVEIYDSSSHTIIDRVPVTSGGSFEFRAQSSPSSSAYDVRVVNQNGDVLRQERFVSGFSNSVPLRLTLSNQPVAARPAAGSVSVGRLRHKPLKKAMKEYDRGLKSRDSAEAIAHLRKAAELDPEFVEAWNNLGTRLIQLGLPAEAESVLRRATQVDPADTRPISNLAIALLHQGKHAEAEQTARQVMRMQRESRHAEYLLGLSLLAQKKNLSEAQAVLERACEELPHARMALSQILTLQGRYADAEAQLTQFLGTSPAPHYRQTVEKWLTALRAQKNTAVAN